MFDVHITRLAFSIYTEHIKHIINRNIATIEDKQKEEKKMQTIQKKN